MNRELTHSRRLDRPGLRLVRRGAALAVVAGTLGFSNCIGRAAGTEPGPIANNLQSFMVTGVVKEVQADRVVVAHKAVPNYMPAMTMPFRVKDPAVLAGLHPGEQVSFKLWVTDIESWIDSIVRREPLSTSTPAAVAPHSSTGAVVKPHHPLLDYAFTNELGQAVRLADFRGQALAITFFFTRCPIPDYCPRLSKNFAEASRKLAALPHAGTNWHFLSVSFDPEFDSPAVLKAYGQRYQYDPSHWSFLTGPADKIRELANLSNVTYEPENGWINHNFRTLIIDANGHLQTIFPIGGDLTDAIVAEILKAAAATPPP